LAPLFTASPMMPGNKAAVANVTVTAPDRSVLLLDRG
jgi:hypothetical protein